MGITLTAVAGGYQVSGVITWEEFVDKESKPAISKDGRDFTPKDPHFKSAVTQVRFRNQPWRNGEIASQLRLQCVVVARGIVKPPSAIELAEMKRQQATTQAYNSLVQAYMLTGMDKAQAESKAAETCGPIREVAAKAQATTGQTAPPSTAGKVGTVTTAVEGAAEESDLTEEERDALK